MMVIWNKNAARDRRADGERDIDCFFAHFEDAARSARPSLLSVDVDYDEIEAYRPSGRIDAVKRLIGVTAAVKISCNSPLATLPAGACLHFQHPQNRHLSGCWLTGPGIEDGDPANVLVRGLEDNRELLELIALQGIAHEAFVADPAWPRLSKSYNVCGQWRADADGVICDAIIELDAC